VGGISVSQKNVGRKNGDFANDDCRFMRTTMVL